MAAANRLRKRYANGVSDRQDQTDGAVKERVKIQKKEPALYKVVLLNDDYTTMDFVMQILETVFQKSPAEAYRIMMHVHLNGSGVAGVYPWEIAETKVETVTALARQAEYPLRAAIEEA
jgi:ATP-dependent Clp protease adaptor protein ClpS